ncbi:hypothetical protein Mal64_24970 [Pseudobythopirellula maris]|uniref:Ribosomal protein L11 methyltransferase n=1 Tax=Pseudobythopirellula maris TaxID=2527991 RepID=A0A5C5ZPA7_9BACT|nr:class I SAM-dependent methyltransferase [Pseudobythopirellula maris]TWT89006.1 hypothetical protein Mal64_24970 [Pseudobythopirellula maris]
MLRPVPLDPKSAPLPQRIKRLLDDADKRIERLVHERRETPMPAFVPSDFVDTYWALTAIEDLGLAPGHRFCEWGSGAGVVTLLAATLGLDAIGVEIEEDLVDLAVALGEDHEIEADFVCASFVPDGGDEILDDLHAGDQQDCTWLRSDGQNAYELLDLEPDDFDLVFAYPWPGEERMVFDLFDEFAAEGALLLTYHGQEGLRLQRKAKRKR